MLYYNHSKDKKHKNKGDIKMKIYGFEVVLNEKGNVKHLLDENGNTCTMWEKSRYGGYDRVDSLSINALRGRLYRDTLLAK